MKKYKVIITLKVSDYSVYYNTYVKYYDTLKEAKEVCKNNENAKYVGAVNVEYHHRGSARGYIRKDRGYRSSYCGRFGEGYKEIIPNVQGSPHGSNNYYYVDYYIETK